MPNIHDTTTGSSESSSEYLQNAGCKIKYSESGGRRVYGALSAVYHMEHEIESEAQFSAASRAIPAHTLLESSPALLFSAEEYEAHGRHTVLDRHSFRWTDGRMALALGLGGISDGPLTLSNYFVAGSLFNRSDAPNVSYSIDTSTESIRFTTTRAVEPDEELCVYYEESSGPDGSAELADGSGVLPAGEAPNHVPQATPDLKEILDDDDLPFIRVKLTSDEDDEETAETVRTGEHVPRSCTRLLMPNRKYSTGLGSRHPRPTTNNLRTKVTPPPPFPHSLPPLTSKPFLRWHRSSGLDTPTLAHLKRVRKSPTAAHSSMLLTASQTAPTPPTDLPPPYQLPVPRSAALTPASLALKNTFWPTVFAPRRKGEPEDWTRARAHWACAAMARVVQEAHAARAAGEVRVCSISPLPSSLMYL